MGALRSTGALDCVSHGKLTKRSLHSYWTKLIGEVVLAGMNDSAVSGNRVCVSGQLKQDEALLDALPTTKLLSGDALEFDTEWSADVLKCIETMRVKTSRPFERATAMLHRQRMLKKDAFSPFTRGILAFNLKLPPDGNFTYDGLNEVALVCYLNKVFCNPRSQRNLFPLQFEALRDCQPHTDESVFNERYWECLGETGVFLAPPVLRLLELDLLIDRLAADAASSPGDGMLIKCAEAQKRLEVVQLPSRCLNLMHKGFRKRLQSMAQDSGRWGCSSFFAKLDKEANKRIERVINGLKINSDYTMNELCDLMQTAIGEAIGAAQTGHSTPWKKIGSFLLGSDECYMWIPIVKHVTKNIKRHKALRSVGGRFVTSIRDSIDDCIITSSKPSARDLQVKLLYPYIAYEGFHVKVPPSYLEKIVEFNAKYGEILKSSPSKYSHKFGVLVLKELEELHGTVTRADFLNAVRSLLQMELGSLCFPEGREERGAVLKHLVNSFPSVGQVPHTLDPINPKLWNFCSIPIKVDRTRHAVQRGEQLRTSVTMEESRKGDPVSTVEE